MARDPLFLSRSFALLLFGALLRVQSPEPSTDLVCVSVVKVREYHALRDDAGDGFGDHCLVLVLTVLRAASAPDIDRDRRTDERQELGRYAAVDIAHVGLEALRATRVSRDHPRRTNPAFVTLPTNDALALDERLEVPDARVLAEIGEGLFLKLGNLVLGSFCSGRGVGVHNALRAPGCSHQQSH